MVSSYLKNGITRSTQKFDSWSIRNMKGYGLKICKAQWKHRERWQSCSSGVLSLMVLFNAQTLLAKSTSLPSVSAIRVFFSWFLTRGYPERLARRNWLAHLIKDDAEIRRYLRYRDAWRYQRTGRFNHVAYCDLVEVTRFVSLLVCYLIDSKVIFGHLINLECLYKEKPVRTSNFNWCAQKASPHRIAVCAIRNTLIVPFVDNKNDKNSWNHCTFSLLSHVTGPFDLARCDFLSLSLSLCLAVSQSVIAFLP